jgi:hypothetical protein
MVERNTKINGRDNLNPEGVIIQLMVGCNNTLSQIFVSSLNAQFLSFYAL